MKSILRFIPMLAFLLGLTAALAGQLTSEEVVTKQALVTQGGQDVWVNIDPDDQEGIDYTCEAEQGRQCTRSLDEEGQVIPELNEMGRYTAP